MSLHSNRFRARIGIATTVLAAFLLSDLASAQTAKNLRCKRCVGARDINKNAITSRKLRDKVVKKAKLSPGLQNHVDERESFYIVLDAEGDGSTATIATHGPLTFFARCIVGFFDPTFFDPDTGMSSGLTVDRIEVVATSSDAPWYEEDESDSTGGSVTVPANTLVAGQEVVVFSKSVTTGNAYFNNDIDEGAIVGPGGHYMAIDGDGLGLGLNVFGRDCTVIGNVFKIMAESAGP